MSQNLNCVPAFNGTNYRYWKARMCFSFFFFFFFFFKSIDVWQIVESGWIKPEDTTNELIVPQTRARLSNDKALHALCRALSLSEFIRISNCESNQEA